MTTGVPCRTCANPLRENAKFCDECGAPTAVSAETAEYKQVTVLFADVVRSMDLAAALDAERMREVMTDLVERSAAVVHRYGGRVEFTGDGVMASFRRPGGVGGSRFFGRAWLPWTSRRRRAGWRPRCSGATAWPCECGWASDSGRVIAGEFGFGALGYAATGQHVGMAQRMESVAPPGGVMVSESTARLVEHTVTLAEPEQVRIKGTDHPVPARRLVAIRRGMASSATSNQA